MKAMEPFLNLLDKGRDIQTFSHVIYSMVELRFGDETKANCTDKGHHGGEIFLAHILKKHPDTGTVDFKCVKIH
ncbi:MAG: hypothetical protein HQK56_15410 [Deltaproteobacteria bacterium]|nr:hypothetical protein [Deltaproteobacteria bacterium]